MKKVKPKGGGKGGAKKKAPTSKPKQQKTWKTKSTTKKGTKATKPVSVGKKGVRGVKRRERLGLVAAVTAGVKSAAKALRVGATAKEKQAQEVHAQEKRAASAGAYKPVPPRPQPALTAESYAEATNPNRKRPPAGEYKDPSRYAGRPTILLECTNPACGKDFERFDKTKGPLPAYCPRCQRMKPAARLKINEAKVVKTGPVKQTGARA